MKKSLAKPKLSKQMWLGAGLLVMVIVGLIAAIVLSNRDQNIQSDASGYLSNCDCGPCEKLTGNPQKTCYEKCQKQCKEGEGNYINNLKTKQNIEKNRKNRVPKLSN